MATFDEIWELTACKVNGNTLDGCILAAEVNGVKTAVLADDKKWLVLRGLNGHLVLSSQGSVYYSKSYAYLLEEEWFTKMVKDIMLAGLATNLLVEILDQSTDDPVLAYHSARWLEDQVGTTAEQLL